MRRGAVRRLYVGSMMSSRNRGGNVDNQIQTFTLLASNRDEAMGMAFGYMERLFPANLGYQCSGKLSEQPRSVVADWLAAYDEGAGEN